MQYSRNKFKVFKKRRKIKVHHSKKLINKQERNSKQLQKMLTSKNVIMIIVISKKSYHDIKKFDMFYRRGYYDIY